VPVEENSREQGLAPLIIIAAESAIPKWMSLAVAAT